MYALILAAAITWPASCEQIGDFYAHAAAIRDKGVPLAKAASMAAEPRVRRALEHVYDRPDMTPEQWRWFVIGVCVGAEGHDKVRLNVSLSRLSDDLVLRGGRAAMK